MVAGNRGPLTLKLLLYTQIKVTYFYNTTNAHFPSSQNPRKISNPVIIFTSQARIKSNCIVGAEVDKTVYCFSFFTSNDLSSSNNS